MLFCTLLSLAIATVSTFQTPARKHVATTLLAKPQRLPDNVEGVVFVNDRCINCAACAGFSPEVFRRENGHHIVHHQPSSLSEIQKTKAALAACPVAAIRMETLAERRHGALDKKAIEDSWSDKDEYIVSEMNQIRHPFPRRFLQDEVNQLDGVPNVYWTGHHNEDSFGAIPYLLKAKHDGKDTWIMVDTPKFSKTAVKEISQITTKIDFLFLTHVDDTADHGKWSAEFGLKEIFHAGDLGSSNWVGDRTLEDVAILLQETSDEDSLQAFALDGTPLDDWAGYMDEDNNVVIFHTPGHSRGSISLFYQEKDIGVLFTGDTYAGTVHYVDKQFRMTGFGRYGRDLRQQAQTLQKLLKVPWNVIAPGHGLPRDYRESEDRREPEMKVAQDDLLAMGIRRY